MQQDSTLSGPSRRPSSLACMTCRRRHLKCDAQMPVCSRCQASSTECRYIQSRRGRTKNSNPSQQLLDDDASLFSAVNPDDFSEWPSGTNLTTDLVDIGQALFQPQLDARQSLLPEDALAWPELENAVTPEVAYDPLIQLYYQTFHRSHPLLIPRKALHSHLVAKIPQYILSIMRFIGAHQHHDPSLKELFRQSAYSVLSALTPRDGFMVQGMVLLAIVEHARGAEDSATRIMQAAVNLALELGMNKAAFAAEHSGGNSILEESWRRTYWELYFVDGFLAAMRDQSAFQLFHSPADVRLPCDEELYNSGDVVIPSNLTFKDLTNKWHFDEERRFPSSAYRIQAVRVMGMVMELNRSLDIDLDTQIETIDAVLAALLMQLPSSQRDAYGSHCGLDEMTFQAQMTSYLALIYLHHPRSNMRYASIHAYTSCTRLPTIRETTPPSASLDLHSQKLLRAADLLCNLATLPNPVKYRTPFFTCALAMCVVVHTVACLVVSIPEKQESIKARIQLGVGALHVLGKLWPLAKTVRQRLISMYQELGLRCR
ncbi:hypothetical protein LV164_003187 [Aspergillus fumigatus]|nr:hypothetical protein KXX42_003353 [Aspergillus fumigatus]KAH1550937.1 hypothetical protein KXX57_009091 [Aspergillus fumigatus]KAH1984769.1 hypothetical protein KXW88_001432 [Aspergillus fumigatus]KAH2319185.1 hypothetical protein KXV47_005156 [Aspergillus fumigatus]KAH2673807.1 hypothetical protein KXV32_007410 [Aspergillus fumigatus]